MKKGFVVTCKKCGYSRKIRIFSTPTGEVIDWLDNNPDPQQAKIVSGRKRLDGLYGWECICGNNDIMTDQERRHLDPQSPDPKGIEQVTKNIKVQNTKFEMREV